MSYTEAEVKEMQERVAKNRQKKPSQPHQKAPNLHLKQKQASGHRASHVPGVMNKTEAAYAQYLELRKRAGEIVDYRFEPFNLRLAANTYIRPDFLVIVPQKFDSATLQNRYIFEIHECKGHWEDDSKAKFKIAREMYPWFRWRVIKRINGQFVESV